MSTDKSTLELQYITWHACVFSRIRLVLLCIFLIITNPMKTNNDLMLVSSTSCVAKAWYILLLWATDLHCCPKTIKYTSVSLTVVLSDMLLYYYEYTHTVVYFDSTSHTPSCHKYLLEHQMCINLQLLTITKYRITTASSLKDTSLQQLCINSKMLMLLQWIIVLPVFQKGCLSLTAVCKHTVQHWGAERIS